MLGIHKISKKQMLRPNAKLLKLRARAEPERAAGREGRKRVERVERGGGKGLLTIDRGPCAALCQH